MSVFLKYKKESKSAFGGKFRLRLYFGDGCCKQNVLILRFFVTNILYLSTLASGTNFQKCHQYRNSVTTSILLSPN